MSIENVSYFAALAAGILSFFSPCVLPLVPAYFTFITGLSLDELTENAGSGNRMKIILATTAYVLGFSFVFILMGVAASSLGHLVSRYSDYIRIAGGVIIILLGFHLTGVFKISGLTYEKRFHFRDKPLHLFGTFIVGMAFGAGWTPCIGPMLSAILTIAVKEGSVTKGILLLSVYSAGMALPFILMSVFIHDLLVFIRKATRVIKYVNLTSGILLIFIGIILLMDKMNVFFILNL